MRITSNYHTRPLLDWSELTKQERAQFAYFLGEEEHANALFFRYHGATYDIGEALLPVPGIKEQGWEGCILESLWSGIVVRYPFDDETGFLSGIVVGRVCWD